MSSQVVTFSQVVAKARQGDEAVQEEASGHRGFGKRTKQTRSEVVAGENTRPEAVADEYKAPSDRQLAAELTQAIARLQDAMDAAIRAGLMVEPKFMTVSGRFNEFGVSVDSHLCTVQIYRKLA